MSWQKATFKGKDVFIEVDSDGDPLVEMGRVPMRYSKRKGSKIYRANLSNVSIDAASSPVELPEGVGADDAKASKGAKKGRGKGFGKAGTRSAGQAAAAKADARERLAQIDASKTVIVFTDGGCSGNPGPAGSGVYAEFPDGRAVAACRSLGRGTNNIAELTAIDIAMDLLDDAGVEADAPVVLFSDSDYANGVLTRGWKAKKNTELILGLREKLASRPGVSLEWVAGHVGIAGNERADQLATAGVGGRSDVVWTDGRAST
jgi:ribonuclease HI